MLANVPTTDLDTQLVLDKYTFLDTNLGGGEQIGNNTENLTSKSWILIPNLQCTGSIAYFHWHIPITIEHLLCAKHPSRPKDTSVEKN